MFPSAQSQASRAPYGLDHANVNLETFFAKVYGWMALGLLATGFSATAVVITPALQHLIFGTPVMWLLFAAQLIIVFAFRPLVQRLPPMAAGAVFLLYATLTGATLSSIFFIYTATSIAGTFFATAGAFGVLSAYGLITRRSLASWGTFLMMGLVGVILASVVNIFIHSSPMGWMISCAGVVVFTGLVAYDTQRIKELAMFTGESGALQGALMLYLDFVNLFLQLLRLFGTRRRD